MTLETEKAMESIRMSKINSHFEKQVLKHFNLLIENIINKVYGVIKTIKVIKETAPKAMRLVAYLTTFYCIKHMLLQKEIKYKV